MASFIDNILKSNITQKIIDMAGEKLQDGTLTELLNNLGGKDRNIGELAAGVINVIGLAKSSFGNKSEHDETSEEEVVEEE